MAMTMARRSVLRQPADGSRMASSSAISVERRYCQWKGWGTTCSPLGLLDTKSLFVENSGGFCRRTLGAVRHAKASGVPCGHERGASMRGLRSAVASVGAVEPALLRLDLPERRRCSPSTRGRGVNRDPNHAEVGVGAGDRAGDGGAEVARLDRESGDRGRLASFGLGPVETVARSLGTAPAASGGAAFWK